MYPEIRVIAETDDVAVALQLMRAMIPDFVIVDINMPKGSGLVLLNDVKNLNLRAKVVMLSNCNNPVYRHRAKHLGAFGFFDKSTECDKLINLLRGEAARVFATRYLCE